jgi:hypothetical protein
VISKQRNSSAAEAAIKLTVFQTDETSARPAAPVQEPDAVPGFDEALEAHLEPKLRETKKTDATASDDVADVVKKWAKK